MNMKRLFVNLCAIMMTLSWCACSDSSDASSSVHQNVDTYKVAVIMGQSEFQNWKRTATWALDNIQKAQLGLPNRIELSLTFKNQDDADIEEYMRQVANDDEVKAIVGPTTSDKATMLAEILKESEKPMLSPCATDAEYQRKYSSAEYVWNMAESDIAQLEILLSNIAANGESKVMLLTYDSDDKNEARNTYVEWFAFIAEEFGIKDVEVLLYKDEQDIRKYARLFCGNNAKFGMSALVFNPSDAQTALALDDEMTNIRKEVKNSNTGYFYAPRILCSDSFVSNAIASKVQTDIYEGIDMWADPTSGFSNAYLVKNGEQMVNGEAQLYDALQLLTYAFVRKNYTQQTDLNQAIQEIVDGNEANVCGWLPTDTKSNYVKLAQGSLPNLVGVSGKWNFDETTHVCQLGTTYRHWRLHNGTFQTLGYYTTDGSKRSSSSKEMWNWTATHYEQFNNDIPNMEYPTLQNRWALVIAASKGWSNYRFQADAFAMYRILKQHGYDDDHIVLVMEDDIAYNPKNIKQGEIKVQANGDNLYDKNAIDYKLSDLTIDDLGKILKGQKTDKLKSVINSTDYDNVFVFWSSHGSNGSLNFGDYNAAYWELQDIFKKVPHRKMMVAVEACFSGGLGKYCEGMEGTLFLTAANPNETSHAAEWDETIGVFRSNGFTKGFHEAINKDPNVTLRDLYYIISRNTDGSHVKIYNEANYGSVFNNNMTEFLN